VKVVILAGGRGTRLSEETTTKPKPMVEIGGRPILWHIMKIYGAFGFKDFLLALGYKGDVIKRYFAEYRLHNSSFILDLSTAAIDVVRPGGEDWRVGLIDTGTATMTGGRIRRLKPYLGQEMFMATYGDGVANIDVNRLLEFHRSHGRLATITAVHPTTRFGALHLDGGKVLKFAEKPQLGEGWVNGGFFVLEPQVIDYIDGDESVFELAPIERLVADGQLMAYRHEGFWQGMDTLREVKRLEELWNSGNVPWKLWDD